MIEPTQPQEERVTDAVSEQGSRCPQCGGNWAFAPGTNALACPFCKHHREIAPDPNVFRGELQFAAFVEHGLPAEHKHTFSVVQCTGCGARPTLPPHGSADVCPFCGAGLVIQGGSQAALLKPQSLLPFLVDSQQGNKLFRAWIRKRWFAPRGLKKYAQAEERLRGIYIPYWTFDSNTFSRYTGARGNDYQVTEWNTDVNGKSQTRTVTKTRWTPVSGQITHRFDDVLVLASRSLPKKYTDRLEPWDLSSLVPYDHRYLLGFQAETYQVALPAGFGEAQQIMDQAIRLLICRDIGGDRQRIDSLDTTHTDVTFKHLLLPVWVSAYTYRKSVYRFLVNGRTGEVQGERPYSWVKISLAILFCLAIVSIGIFLFLQTQ